MKIGFAGAGKVGCSLGKYLSGYRDIWTLKGYYSRSSDSAEAAAVFTGSSVYRRPEEMSKDCDVIFVTTPDGCIADFWRDLRNTGINFQGKILVHCSGALTSDIFADADKAGATVASLHPFYAVSDKFGSYQYLKNALFTLEGSGERLEELQTAFMQSGLTIQPLAAEHKTAYHAAAVVGSNLMVGLSEIAIELLTGCGFDRAHARMALQPLMSGNLTAVMQMDTAAALTGPAERADLATIKNHLSVLDGDDQQIYRLLTRRLIGIAKQKNPDRDYQLLEQLLEDRGF